MVPLSASGAQRSGIRGPFGPALVGQAPTLLDCDLCPQTAGVVQITATPPPAQLTCGNTELKQFRGHATCAVTWLKLTKAAGCAGYAPTEA